MTMSFPRAMPLIGVGQQIFEQDRADFLTREQSGRLGGMTAGFPIWKGQWTLASAITVAMSDDWRAFVASLEGPARLFFGYDVERRFPAAYPQGFGGLSWDGDADSWAQTIDAGAPPALALGGLPAGLIIGPGDYVGFRWQTEGEERRALVRSLEAVVADGSGDAAFAITPAVPALTPEDAVAYLAEPDCLMRLDPRGTQVGAMGRRRTASMSIVAIQDLLP